VDHGQLIFFSVACIFLIIQAVSGWRLGLVREIVKIAALGVSYAAAYLFSPQVVPLLRPLHYPDFILHGIAGVSIALVCYVVIRFLSGILFRKTSDQEFGLVWFFYGITGALLGVAFGLVFVVAGAIALRFAGTLMDTKPTAQPVKTHTVASGPKSRKPAAQIQPAPASSPSQENPVILTVVALKRSLEKGLPGEVLQVVDPVPKNIYVIAGKIGQAVSNPEAITRFFTYPGAQELARNPEILKLREDPEIMKALESHNYTSLLRNEHVIQVVNNPKIAEQLKRFDLEKALDYANANANGNGNEGGAR
jgi:uncharacterized membrane protein required for colicin V production